MKNILYELRTKKGLTQADVAKKLNISQQAYYRYENSDIKTISIETILKLSAIFDTKVTYILGFDTQQEEKKSFTELMNELEKAENITNDELIQEREKLKQLINNLSYYSCLEANAFIRRLIARDEKEEKYWQEYEKIHYSKK